MYRILHRETCYSLETMTDVHLKDVLIISGIKSFSYLY